jgi:hypothetical protein
MTRKDRDMLLIAVFYALAVVGIYALVVVLPPYIFGICAIVILLISILIH